MVKNYLKVALRSLLKNRVFSFINIAGLALGIAASLLILQYVNYELSYEDFNKNAERVYRLKTNRYDKGELSTEWAAGVVSIGPILHENLPQVVEYARLSGTSGVMSREDIEFKEEKMYFSSPGVIELMDLKILHGEAKESLNSLYTIVVSETAAKKYFGKVEVVGETLYFNKNRPVKIGAVFQDLPANTHFKFDILVSWPTAAQGREEEMNTVWYWDGYFNYIMLEEGVDPVAFEKQVNEFVADRWGDEMREGESWMDFELQALSDIHLYSNYMLEAEVNGDSDAVFALLFISFFIIVIAWVNYINLATAKSMERAKEVGLRKVLGSQKGQLIRQFLTESILVNLFAVVLAFALVLLVLPAFAKLAEQPTSFELFTQQGFWLGLISLFVLGTLLSGLYPAFVLSSFKPVQTLKGNFVTSSKGGLLRRGLVIFQFIASIALIIGTYTVYEQISFMRNQQLGVNIDQTLVLNGPSVRDSTYQEKLSAFTDVMKADANVENVVVSTGVPGRAVGWNAGGIRLESAPETDGKQYRVLGVGYDFVEAYGLEVVAGRSFSKNFGNEEANILFTEKALKQLGFDNPEDGLGKRVSFWGDVYTVIGVLEDYHHESLKEDYDHVIYRLIPNASNFYSVKFNGANTQAVVNLAQEKWMQFFPGNPFEYFFLDDAFNEQYKADQRFGTVFTIFSGLAIFVACMGLFGLASFMVAKRTKEIGIRKVLGATVPNILRILSTDFMKPILVAIIIAIPLAYYAMDMWLAGFAFRIAMSWYIFALPAVLVTIVALLTVSVQTSSAARANPVKSLRYE
ncbi:ABC transporter permease [Roseivirga pacifica]|uniref:ABC transporter permease n=1 Tax=Roseivirga pacifica TaxID=1267423 RepID=UPI002094B78E|nr:ABC transporter permease [Roseivirga pacifica]MCO6359752.1 FtsX-like permease family protein [Roseivirga pacifica]MCO6367122.1 FtsX-like permease family protein [Roseivirga pacifica]MCO6370346.1 FtsX-like permease family protein [Roseivirga pacifica]MCO6374779.1 FtsX-like permease family protein [Roseivirga pacifica]MCO6380037.1 FtsX-like permease family protein [Roseivirga pacifica]